MMFLDSLGGGFTRFISQVRSATASEKQCSSRCGFQLESYFPFALLLRGTPK